MNRTFLAGAFAVLGIFAFHLQAFRYTRRLFACGRRAKRWTLPLCCVNTGIFAVLAWSPLHIFTVYLLMTALYLAENALLFHAGPLHALFVGVLFPFVLLGVRGVMIPFFALTAGTNLYGVVASPCWYSVSLAVSLFLCCPLLWLQRRMFPDEHLRLLLACQEQAGLTSTSLCLLFAYLVLESYVYYYDFPHIWTLAFHLLTSVVAVACFYTVLWYAIDISTYIEYELKTRQVEKQLQRQVSHYQQFTRYVQELRAFKHDYQRMADAVRWMVETGERETALELLGQMNHEMENSLHYTRYANHVVVDAILQECAGRCADNRIAFSATVNLPGRIGLSDLELCRIFGNLVDNAFEACSEVPESSERFLSLTSSSNGGWVTVELRNPFAGEIELDGEGNPVSRKDDRFQHGIGLVSVRQIVERGGGFLQIEIDPQSHIFAARLHFCVS